MRGLCCCNPINLIALLPQNYFHSLSNSKLYNSISLSAFHRQTGLKFKFHYPPSSYTHNELLDFFNDLLLRCRNSRQLYQVHAQIVSTGLSSSGFLASKLISVYARFGGLSHALNVFESMHLESLGNYLLWNSIMRASVGGGQCMQAMRIYIRMRKVGIFGDGLTFPLVIRACTMLGNDKVGRNVHGHVLCMGYQINVHVQNALIDMYGKIGQMTNASKMFDRMTVRNQVSWNTMVSAFANNSESDGALKMFRRMETEGWEPNIVTWTSLLSSLSRFGDHKRVTEYFCMMRSRGIQANAETVAVVLSVFGNVSAYRNGELVHGYVVKGGLEDYLFVKNALISMYGKHGNPKTAHRVFLEMEARSLVTWNALISSYAECGLGDEAFAVFSELDKSECINPNVISWSAVISGFGLMDKTDESLDLFRKMQLSGVLANVVTLCSVLRVCANSATLRMGKEIHGHGIKALTDTNILVGNSLLNMYMKCGSLRIGHLVFERITGTDLISWNSLIDGYGIHGFGAQALETFNKMIKSRVMPDAVTFVALLSACGHAGLVDEGRRLFHQMTTEFNIEAQLEHYACIVDILGRGGFLEEASVIVQNMPMVPNEWVWGALLNSCRMHRDVDIAETIASRIFQLHPETTGSYMLMSNIYASNERWEDSARTRISARTNGLKKVPGQSWIEVNKSVHVFQAGHVVEKALESVYEILKMLTFKTEIEGYASDDGSVLLDLEG
ncbi:hypothetical protein QQ045_024483 [Rhodiola kirilowii]